MSANFFSISTLKCSLQRKEPIRKALTGMWITIQVKDSISVKIQCAWWKLLITSQLLSTNERRERSGKRRWEVYTKKQIPSIGSNQRQIMMMRTLVKKSDGQLSSKFLDFQRVWCSIQAYLTCFLQTLITRLTSRSQQENSWLETQRISQCTWT